MNKFMFVFFPSIFFLDYLAHRLNLISRYATWIPELLSIAMILVVVIRLANQRKAKIPTKYKVVLVLLVINVLMGLVMNSVGEGPIIAGLRSHVKFLPFFLLPMVYDFSDKEIKNQFRILIAFLIIQFPIALYQRFIQFGNIRTGDEVRGTVATSSFLSILMYLSITILIAFYMHKKIKLKTLFPLLILLFIPTGINGTKASFFLLPLAIFIPVFLYSNKGRLKYLVVMGLISLIAFPVFIALSDKFQSRDYDKGLMDFMTREGRMENYLYKGVSLDDHKFKHLGRVDSYILAAMSAAQDPWRLVFGVGIGNTQNSFISGLSGDYGEVAARYGGRTNTVAYLIWELGFLGLSIYSILLYLIYKDSAKLRKRDEFAAVLALGWCSVCLLMVVGFFYKNIFLDNTISYLFWYFSGYIAAKEYRCALAEKRRRFIGGA